jgi:hypothetical protein
MLNPETSEHTAAKIQPIAPVQDAASRKMGEARLAPAKPSLLRKIRLKIGGKVADLFTW